MASFMGDTDHRTKVQSYFESESNPWEQRYDGAGMEAHSYVHRQEVALEQLSRHVVRGGMVLDAGCGPGYLSAALERAGFQVISCDLSLRMARATFERRANGLVVVADLDRPPFPKGRFDAIVLIGFISYVADVPELLNRIRALLKPDGVLVVSSANRNPLLNAIGGKLSAPFYRLGVARQKETQRDRFFSTTCNYYRTREFNTLVSECGYRLMENRTIGFGRLRILGKAMLPERLDLKLSGLLSTLVHWPPFRPLSDYAFNNIACFRVT